MIFNRISQYFSRKLDCRTDKFYAKSAFRRDEMSWCCSPSNTSLATTSDDNMIWTWQTSNHLHNLWIVASWRNRENGALACTCGCPWHINCWPAALNGQRMKQKKRNLTCGVYCNLEMYEVQTSIKLKSNLLLVVVATRHGCCSCCWYCCRFDT